MTILTRLKLLRYKIKSAFLDYRIKRLQRKDAKKEKLIKEDLERIKQRLKQ